MIDFETHNLPDAAATLPAVDQLYVLGRGMNGDEPSRLTVDRALATRMYVERFRPMRVVFCGAVSASIEGDTAGRKSEAQALADIADVGSLTEVSLDEVSRSTLRNMTEIRRQGLFNRLLLTGLMLHEAHGPRSLFLGHRILNPSRPIIGIRAEAFGFEPEDGNASLGEAALYAKERVILAGVKPGDFEAAEWRDEHLWAPVRHLGKVPMRALGLAQRYNVEGTPRA